MKSSKTLVLLAMLVLAISGCIQNTAETGNQIEKPGKITVTDFAGRNVTLKKVPERVIVLTGYWAEILHILGLDDRIVGIGTYVPGDQYLPEDVRQKPAVGSSFKGGFNWETVASLEPDLIIADWYGGKYMDEEIIEKAEEIGTPVVALTAKSVEDNVEVVEILGKVFGKDEEAEELSNWMRNKLEEVDQIASQIPADKKKNVLVISAPKGLSGPVTVYAKGSAWASIVELVGAHNLAFDKEFDTQWPKLDLEKIIAYWGESADVVIVVSFNQEKLEKAVNEIKNDPRWKEIKAVREGNVYGILAGTKFGHFLDWGPRIVVGVYQFGCAIYPEYYPRWQNVADELLSFYGMGFNRTVVDTEGREVKVPLKVERVVVLISQVAEMMYCWGEFDKIVGITRYSKDNPLLVKLTSVEEIPAVGSGRDPNVEAIISLKPDVVITYGGEYGYSTPKTVIDQLEKAGIPVILVELDSLDEVYQTIEIVGKILDRENEARDMADYVERTVALVKEEAGKIPEDKRVKAVWLWSKPTKVTGNSGVTNDLIVNAGAINPASEVEGKYVEVQLEKIVAWNPDVIVIWNSARYEPEDLINDPRWQDISAIKERRVYKQPALLSDTWSIRVAVLQAWLLDKFYPGRIDFESLANEFFEHFYGVSYEELEKEVK